MNYYFIFALVLIVSLAGPCICLETNEEGEESKLSIGSVETGEENELVETGEEKELVETGEEKESVETGKEKEPIETKKEKEPIETEKEKEPIETEKDTETTDNTFCQINQITGFQCADCSSPVYCLKNGDNWIQRTLSKCPDKTFCNRSQQKCSTEKDCEDNKEITQKYFECFIDGIIPNPYDCSSFYVCVLAVTTKPEPIKCSDGLAFNPLTNTCDVLKKDYEACKKPQFECNKTFDKAAWPTNKKIYYICMTTTDEKTKESFLYPEIYRCGIDEIFDNESGNCISEKNQTEKPTSTGTTQSTNITTISTATPPLVQCIKTGIFEDTNDCKGYIYCTPQLQMIKRKCPSNSHFDKSKKSCVLGANC